MEKSNNSHSSSNISSHSSKTELTTKPTKKTKLHKILKIIMWVLIVSGIGVGIYFFIKSLTKNPPTQPDPCGEGIAESCGGHACCTTDKPKCCGGECYLPSDYNCINGITCPKYKECGDSPEQQKECNTTGCDLTDSDGSTYTCCGKLSGEYCLRSNNTCTACTVPCQGTNEGKAAICCGKNDNACRFQNDKTNTDPCTCCGEIDTGISGSCCTDNTCLCPGESYGKIPVKVNNKALVTRDQKNNNNNCALGDTNVVCLNNNKNPNFNNLNKLQQNDIKRLAVDYNGNICDVGKLIFDNNELVCCDNANKKLCCIHEANCNSKCPTSDNSDNTGNSPFDCKDTFDYGITPSKTCCDNTSPCTTKSICYNTNDFTKISPTSPLKGFCSSSSSSSNHTKVCMNTTENIDTSSLSPCVDTPCSNGEECVTQYYTPIPNFTGVVANAICHGNGNDKKCLNTNSSCNIGADCMVTGDNYDIGFINNNDTEAGKCQTDDDCGGTMHDSTSCINIETGIKTSDCTQQYPVIPLGNSDCNSIIGCPEPNPIFYCNKNQFCNQWTYTEDDKTKTSGFCSSIHDSIQTSPESTTPNQFTSPYFNYYIGDDDQAALQNCKDTCETKRNGTCVPKIINHENNSVHGYMCEIGLCTDNKKPQTGYVTEDSTKTMSAGTVIDIQECCEKNPCTVADCRILLNKPGIKRINGKKSTESNDGTYSINCSAEYSCSNKDSLERPGILTSDVNSTWTSFSNSKAYSSSTGLKTLYGPPSPLIGKTECDFQHSDGSFNYTLCNQYL